MSCSLTQGSEGSLVSLTVCTVFNPLTFQFSFAKCTKSLNLEFDQFVSKKTSFPRNVKLCFLVSLTS